MKRLATHATAAGRSDLVDPNPDCPTAHLHTRVPASYLDRSEWFAAKSKTHRQKRCEGCGRFTIWKRRAL